MAGSPPNFHKMDSRSACIQGVLKVKVKVKGHVIRALSWILGMSYSVIDGLVFQCWDALSARSWLPIKRAFVNPRPAIMSEYVITAALKRATTHGHYYTNSYWRWGEYLKLFPRNLEYSPRLKAEGNIPNWEYCKLRGKNFKYSPITSVTICFVIPLTIQK